MHALAVYGLSYDKKAREHERKKNSTTFEGTVGVVSQLDALVVETIRNQYLASWYGLNLDVRNDSILLVYQKHYDHKIRLSMQIKQIQSARAKDSK